MAERTVHESGDGAGSVLASAPSPAGPGAGAAGLGEQRPVLSGELSGAELRRWYWLRSELAAFAREAGVSTAGKAELTERLAAFLDGSPAPEPAPRRRPSSRQLTGELTVDTVIPPGQRCSQALRGFFSAHIGPAFAFDGAIRSFVSESAGATSGEAIAHWQATRDRSAGDIGPRFELNRFTRRWHLEYPGGDRADLLRAWAAYRAAPVDHRGSA